MSESENLPFACRERDADAKGEKENGINMRGGRGGDQKAVKVLEHWLRKRTVFYQRKKNPVGI